MAQRITSISVDEFRLYLRGRQIALVWFAYTPKSHKSRLDRLSGRVESTDWNDTVKRRMERMVDSIVAMVPPEEFAIDDQTVTMHPDVQAIGGYPNGSMIKIWYPAGEEARSTANLTPSQLRLYRSVVASLSTRAWSDFRERVSMPIKSGMDRPRVFISYRHGNEKFAEALARRLGNEGLMPWFDRWDIKAGDSLPGKIEEAFRTSVAFLPIMTQDYQAGAWATEELQAAIAKRINEGFKIVPVLLEQCKAPELIAHLVYVDMTSHDPETFEGKIAELVDAIYGLELNPFRDD